MRRLLLLAVLLAVVLVACEPSAPAGTLGLPSSRPSQSGALATASSPATTPTTTSAAASPTRSATASPTRTATGTPTPTPSPTPTAGDTAAPGIVAASATQLTLTLAFSEPMKTGLGCGATGAATASPGSIDGRSAYRSSDAAFDEALASATRATIGADCASITFEFSLAAPAGTFTLSVGGVQDLAGNAIDADHAGATLRVQDEGRPVAIGADALGDRIFVTFSEPMLKIGEGSGVTMNGNYRLDGVALTAAQITCDDAGCRRITIALAAGTLVRGRTYTLRIANVVDRGGLGILPDPSNVTFTDR